MSDHEFHGGAAGSFASEGCAVCVELEERASWSPLVICPSRAQPAGCPVVDSVMNLPVVDVQDRMAAMVGAERAPEGVSVLVAGPAGLDLSVELATEAAPLVAQALYPGRRFGAVIHIESGDLPGTFYVAVEALGPGLGSVSYRPMPAERKS